MDVRNIYCLHHRQINFPDIYLGQVSLKHWGPTTQDTQPNLFIGGGGYYKSVYKV